MKNFKHYFIIQKIIIFLRKIKYLIKITGRQVDIFFMFLSLNLYPKITFKFSTRKCLPSFNDKHKIKDKNLIPIEVFYSDLKTKQFDEVNIIGHGDSFDINSIKKFNRPTFLVSNWNAIREKKDGVLVRHFSEEDIRFDYKTKHLKIYNDENLYYLTARKDMCNDLIKNNCKIIYAEGYRKLISGQIILGSDYNKSKEQKEEIFKFDNYKNKNIIKVYENFYKPYKNFKHSQKSAAPCGSFVFLALAIIPFCKKINIYGWDFYLKKSVKVLNKLEIQKHLFNIKNDLRSFQYFESALLNYYYAYKLSKIKNIVIDSYLDGLDKHKSLIDKIEKVLFR